MCKKRSGVGGGGGGEKWKKETDDEFQRESVQIGGSGERGGFYGGRVLNSFFFILSGATHFTSRNTTITTKEALFSKKNA